MERRKCNTVRQESVTHSDRASQKHLSNTVLVAEATGGEATPGVKL